MIAKVVSSGGGGGSGLAGYIAGRGRDERLEGPDPRPLFTNWLGEDRDGMSVGEANGHLAGDPDRIPDKDEVLHLIVSLTEKEFEALGDTNAERADRLKSAIRDGLSDLEREVGVKDLRYAAGIHLNTENPHVHIAVQKEAPERDSDRTIVVDRLPRSLFPERASAGLEAPRARVDERAPAEEKTLVAIFQRAVEAREAPVRMVQFQTQGSRGLEMRALLPEGEREPSEAERRVGRWLVLESTPDRDLSPHERRERQALTAFVRGLDRRARSGGEAQPLAYVERESLRELISRERVVALDANGAMREPYSGHEVHGVLAEPERGPGSEAGERGLTPLEVLGREVSLRLTVEHLSWRLEVAARTRDTRRVRVSDADHGGVERRMSARDITSRAEAAAWRTAAAEGPATAAERAPVHARELEIALSPHRDALDRIERKHIGHMAHLGKELAAAREALRAVAPEAHAIRAAFRAAGAEAKPAIELPEIRRLQDEAIDRSDVTALTYLERLRPEGARTPEESARLLARSFVAQTEKRLADKRAYDFEVRRHLRSYDVDGQKHSLASVEKQRRAAEREAAFFTARADAIRDRLEGTKTWTHHGVITAWKRDEMEQREGVLREKGTARANDGKRLEPVRVAVANRIAEERSALARDVDKASGMASALESIADAERERMRAEGRMPPEPLLTARELERLEEAAQKLRDPQLLYTVDDARARDSQVSAMDRAARAEGRALAAAVEHERTTGHERTHHANVKYVPQLYRDRHGDDRVAAIRDVEPKGWLNQATRGIFDERDVRQARADVYAAEASTRDRLERDSRDAARFAAAAREAARTASERATLHANDRVAPTFTPREATRIEAFAAGARDAEPSARYAALISDALGDGRVGQTEAPALRHPTHEMRTPSVGDAHTKSPDAAPRMLQLPTSAPARETSAHPAGGPSEPRSREPGPTAAPTPDRTHYDSRSR
jgi:hypothetical protein